MKFLVDENVREEVSNFLKNNGHDIIFPFPRMPDDKISKLAKEEKRIILTHDSDFANIISYPPEKYAGIIRIRIHPPTANVIIEALAKLLEKLPEEKIKGRLIILEKDDFRIR